MNSQKVTRPFLLTRKSNNLHTVPRRLGDFCEADKISAAIRLRLKATVGRGPLCTGWFP